jgi:hypothetical protein
VIFSDVMAAGDLPMASALAAIPLRIEATVDGRSRNVGSGKRPLDPAPADVAWWLAASLRKV